MNSRRNVFFGIVLGLAALLGGGGQARADLFTVDSKSGPWDWVSGGLNSAYTYGVDNSPPLVIGAANGFDFTTGGTFTITYVSGLTSPFGGAPYADGVGDTGYDASDSPGSTGMYFPSLYMSPYPIYLNALVGTFADDTGMIVGTPFYIGNGATVMAPVGATRLQLGVNDDFFDDNTGALVVDVRAVPEPSGLALLGVGIGSLYLARRRLVRRSAQA